MLKGNIGEKSELYTLFKLLSEGKLYSADENLNRTDSFVEIVSIKRNDLGKELNYKIGQKSKINIIDANSNELILSFSQKDADTISKKIAIEIKSKIEISKELSDALKQLYIYKVSEKSTSKGDINILIYDPVHGVSSNQKFSIKSFLGSDPTLFNAHKTTNILYKIADSNGLPVKDTDRQLINDINTGHKYINRISKILELGYSINFHSFEDSTFKLNLQLIDSSLPEIIAFIVLDKYVNRITKITDVIDKLNSSNPMDYDMTQSHKFYEYRIVNFLVEAALGMTSKSVWSGEYDVVGGIIIVKPDTELVCYHLIDFNKFKKYLKNSSRLDNPSGSKMGYGTVYLEGMESFIKLNFQIKS